MIIDTSRLSPSDRHSTTENLSIYNGLDCCLTVEVFEQLSATHGPKAGANAAPWEGIYAFERALQAPYLDLMLRGFKVNDLARRQAAHELRGQIGKLEAQLNELAKAVWDKGVNPRSPLQLKSLFYEVMKFPEVWLSQKGERKLSTNREALEKLADGYLYARPFVNHILAIRDLAKQLEVFESDIDADGRFRASYNIAGTETGRPSSSENAFGTGRNAQNIAPGLRYVFCPDRGKRLCVIDLEQVEARDVGFFIGCLFGDWDFLDSCESGDLHTNNAKRIWPELGWTGDRKADRAIADRIFYRDFSFRDMAKRGSHLSNYMGTAWTAARSLKVPPKIMEIFQARYCRGGQVDGRVMEPAFPGIPRWWQWTAEQLQTTATLTTPFGRRRQFFGRPSDDTTLREAIAFLPQSTTADRMNLGLWRTWKHEPRAELLAQTYDSITFQFDEGPKEDEIISNVLELIKVELRSPSGRSYVVPGEAKVGWNWGSEVTARDVEKAIAAKRRPPRLNPEGLRKWKLGVKDERKRASGLDTLML